MKNLLQHFLDLGMNSCQSEKIARIFKNDLVLQRGKYFHKNSEICQKMGFVVEGVCRYYYETDKGEFTHWLALEGDFVTTLGSFICQKSTTENIQAITNTKIVYATFNDWQKLYKEESFVRDLYANTLEEQYKSMENRLFNMVVLSAEQRYDWILEHHPKFNQQVSDKYLASILGITPRHLSRIRGNYRGITTC